MRMKKKISERNTALTTESCKKLDNENKFGGGQLEKTLQCAITIGGGNFISHKSQ